MAVPAGDELMAGLRGGYSPFSAPYSVNCRMRASLEMGAMSMPTGEQLIEAASRRMNKFADEHLGRSDQHALTKVLVGTPADEIVRYADDQEAAMIVMSTHGYSGVKHFVLGSAAEAVLRQASCPVVAIPAT